MQSVYITCMHCGMRSAPRRAATRRCAASSSPVSARATLMHCIRASARRCVCASTSSAITITFPPVLAKCLAQQQREQHRRITTHLYRCSIRLNFAPGYGFIWFGTRVTAIKLLRSVDQHCKIGAVAHQVGVVDVVLGHTWSTRSKGSSLSQTWHSRCCVVLRLVNGCPVSVVQRSTPSCQPCELTPPHTHTSPYERMAVMFR